MDARTSESGPRRALRHALRTGALAGALALQALAAPARTPLGGPALAGHTLAERYDAGETATWVFEQDGKRIGSSWARCEGRTDLAGVPCWSFKGGVELGLDTPAGRFEQRYVSDLWTDERGRALRVSVVAEASGSLSSSDSVLRDGKASVSLFGGRRQRQTEVQVERGAFALANNFVSQLELLLALEAPAAGQSATFAMYSPNVVQGFELKVEHTGEVEVPGQGRCAQFRDSLGEILTLSASGKLVEFEMPQQKIRVRRVTAGVETFELDRPKLVPPRADFESEDVRIVDGAVSLAGVLTWRKGVSGKRPAVFFLSGSGPQDRDGFGSGIDVGTHEILDRLTQDGFTVLRVDDRGVGDSTGPTDGLTFDDLVADGRRCWTWLAAREDVDPARIAVLGHSEGGELAPALAAAGSGERPALAAMVLLAAPARPLDALMREQFALQAELSGSSGEQRAALAKSLDAFFAAVASGAPIDASSLPEELATFLPARAWLASHLLQRPLETLAQVRCPILILQGGRDVQVSPERDAQALEAALTACGHADHRLVTFETLDHLFKETAGGPSAGLDYFRPRPVAPAVLDTLSAWLAERLKP